MSASRIDHLLFFLSRMDTVGDRLSYLYRLLRMAAPFGSASIKKSDRTARLRLNGLTIHYAPFSGELFGTYCDIFKDQMYTAHPAWIPADGMVIMDIGANIGMYALFASRQAPRSTIYAFEPNPYAFGKLTKNMEANGCSNVILSKQALGSREGSSFLRVVSTSSTISAIVNIPQKTDEKHEIIPTAMSTVDAVVKSHGIEKIDIMKIDVEGYAVEVLEGASESLSKVMHIVLEVHNPKERDLEKNLFPQFIPMPIGHSNILYLRNIASP